MKVGIVGLPQVGKTTIFRLLTQGRVDTSSWGSRREAHIGIAHVPDVHVDKLAEIIKPEKTTYATIQYVDLPGLSRGDGKAASAGQAKEMATYLTSLKNVDALLHVVRAFEDASLPHVEGSVDPSRDIELFELEMIFSDLAVVEKRLERLSKDLKKTKSPDLEMENDVLLRYKEALENEKPLRELELTPEEEKRVRGFTFLSGEADRAGHQRWRSGFSQKFRMSSMSSGSETGVQTQCRHHRRVRQDRIQIAALPPEDARMFMEDLGISWQRARPHHSKIV